MLARALTRRAWSSKPRAAKLREGDTNSLLVEIRQTRGAGANSRDIVVGARGANQPRSGDSNALAPPFCIFSQRPRSQNLAHHGGLGTREPGRAQARNARRDPRNKQGSTRVNAREKERLGPRLQRDDFAPALGEESAQVSYRVGVAFGDEPLLARIRN